MSWTIPPSRFETIWSRELGMTRPWPRTVRSSSVSEAQTKKVSMKATTNQSSRFGAVRGLILVVGSSRWVPCKSGLYLGCLGPHDLLENVVARPVRDDLALLQQDDSLDELKQRRTMGDEDQGSALQLLLKPLDQPPLGLGVHRAGRLVHHHDRRPAGERARDRDRLALAAGQALAPVREPEVVAVGDLAHELMGAGDLGGADQLLVAHLGAPERDILAHRPGQQHA